MADPQSELEKRRQQGLLRKRRTLQSAQGPGIQMDGARYTAFCSNDYLGLANHPRVIEALTRAAEHQGVGSGASHLVCGHHQSHHDLEQALAELTGREAALLFSTGYMANLGVIDALSGRRQAVLQDRLNHASLIDGARLSDARLVRYAHADTEALGRQLEAQDSPALVATDGVFSMDGDVAPLTDIASLCRDRDVPLLVDDAHGLGVLGQTGGGVVEALSLSQEQVPLLVGTLGKAMGVAGAFVAGSRTMIEYLVQQARTYIYTTAMPGALAQATLESLAISREESWRRERLASLVQWFRAEAEALGYELMPSRTPIQPLVVGSSEAALALSEALEAQGILVTAIRPPTVPEGTARLRFTFSAAHSDAQMEDLVRALGKVRERGLHA